MNENTRPQLILPIGTQVVVRLENCESERVGLACQLSVGKIVKCPTDAAHSYLVQFPDGSQASFLRGEISIRKQVQAVDFARVQGREQERELLSYVIYRCLVGSRAYGLSVEDSDRDCRGIFLPPARLHWSLYGLPEQIEIPETQDCFWELQKFLVLALKANPNVLECLYSPVVEVSTVISEELLAGREHFLSKLVYQTYNGYVLSQFKKLEQDLRTRGQLKWKHVMHLLRLLSSGITILREGLVPVVVAKGERERLLAIRRGEIAWEEVNEWRLKLHKEFDAAQEVSRLPERPDYDWVNDFLVRSRQARAD